MPSSCSGGLPPVRPKVARPDRPARPIRASSPTPGHAGLPDFDVSLKSLATISNEPTSVAAKIALLDG
jgi:hypothetical protein